MADMAHIESIRDHHLYFKIWQEDLEDCIYKYSSPNVDRHIQFKKKIQSELVSSLLVPWTWVQLYQLQVHFHWQAVHHQAHKCGQPGNMMGAIALALETHHCIIP